MRPQTEFWNEMPEAAVLKKCGSWTSSISISITGNLLEMQIFRPTSNRLNQNFWAWGQQSGFYGALQEPLMHARVRKLLT